MKIVLVLLLFYGDSPVVHEITGFNDMAICNIAGKKIMDSELFEYEYTKQYDFECIIVDNNKKVEKE